MQKIVVFGSFVREYITRQPSLPVPGQTLIGSRFFLGLGGKGSNQAVAAAKAGADVTFITKLGDDDAGHAAMEFYRQHGMNTDHIIVDPTQTSGAALIMTDEITSQNQIVVVSGACGTFNDDDLERSRPLLESADIVLFQQEINDDAQFKAIRIAHDAGARVVLNPAPARQIPDEIWALVDTVTPNETEAQTLTGVTVTDLASAETAAKVFFDRGVKNVVITMGSMGAFASDGKQQELLPRLQVTPVDTTGAGDAFNGGMVTAMSEGHDLFTALRYGNVTGALSVTKVGSAVAMPTRAEIDTFYAKHYK